MTNLDGGKGIEIIPTRRTELLINLQHYLLHQNPETVDGWGDVPFLLKYRFLARNEQHGGVVVTGFLGARVPTGSYKNGSSSAVITSSLAAGKGPGGFDVQTMWAARFR